MAIPQSTIITWLGTGLDADLPDVTDFNDNLAAGAAARYYAYDTGIDYVLNRDTPAWDAIGGAGSGGINELTGDVTAGPGVGSQAVTLATVNSNVGSFTYASLTVNAKGLITAASSGSAPVAAANPTATASDTAVNGVATTYMRSDAAPAIQKATAAQFGVVEVDDSSIAATAGVIGVKSTYAGQSSITTVGTIGTGTWAGTTIAVDHGGTGQTSYTNGQLLIGNTSGNTLAKGTLTGGKGISVTNGAGSITVALANDAVATAQWVSGAVVANGTIYFAYKCPFAGTIASLDYFAGNGSFTVAVKINGTNVTSLSAVNVNSATPANTSATGANTVAINDIITGVISSATGSPTDAVLSLNITRT